MIYIDARSTNLTHTPPTMPKLRGRKASQDWKATEVDQVAENQPHNPYTEIQILSHHSDFVRLLTKIDWYRCASASDDCRVALWEMLHGRRLHTLHGHTRPVTSMCLLEPSSDSLDNLLLLTGASDKIICVWDVEGGTCVYKVTEYDATVRCLLTLRECELFCAGGEKLCLWDRMGRLLHRYDRTEAEDIQRMIVMRNDLLITVVDKQLVTYSLQPNATGDSWRIHLFRKLPPHRDSIKSLIVINEGCFASGSLDGTIYLWAVPAMIQIKKFNCMRDYKGDDKLYPYSIQCMVCVEERYIFCAMGSGICVYDVRTSQLIAQKQQAHYSKVLDLQFVYNGHFLATCSEDGTIRLWGTRQDSDHSVEDMSPDPEDLSKPKSILETFLNKSKSDIQSSSKIVVEPQLLGECLAHSGAVQMLLDFDGEGFLSCGVDGLLIAWKDGVRQSQCRNEMIREMLIGESMPGVV